MIIFVYKKYFLIQWRGNLLRTLFCRYNILSFIYYFILFIYFILLYFNFILKVGFEFEFNFFFFLKKWISISSIFSFNSPNFVSHSHILHSPLYFPSTNSIFSTIPPSPLSSLFSLHSHLLHSPPYFPSTNPIFYLTPPSPLLHCKNKGGFF